MDIFTNKWVLISLITLSAGLLIYFIFFYRDKFTIGEIPFPYDPKPGDRFTYRGITYEAGLRGRKWVQIT